VLRNIRQRKGLTQAALAAKLNVSGWDLSRDTLAKIESRARWVADFEIVKLAYVLGIDGPELLRMAIFNDQQEHTLNKRKL
jgi:transcriptional regulator with XRE-family HTH domain